MKGRRYTHLTIHMHPFYMSEYSNFFFKKRSEYSDFSGLLHPSRNPGAHTALQPTGQYICLKSDVMRSSKLQIMSLYRKPCRPLHKAMETHYCFCIAVRIELNNWYHNSEHETLVSTISKLKEATD